MFSFLKFLFLLAIAYTWAATTDEENDSHDTHTSDPYINIQKSRPIFTSKTVLFSNKLDEPIGLCWLPYGSPTPTLTKNQENGKDKKMTLKDLLKKFDVCVSLDSDKVEYLTITVGDRWHLITAKSRRSRIVHIIGGVHNYDINEDYMKVSTNEYFEKLVASNSIAYVRTHHSCIEKGFDVGWDVLGPTYRDAARRAAKRHNLALCLCGDHNATSTFTIDFPNAELPIILDGEKCKCAGDQQNGHIESGQPIFDMWIPCTFGRKDALELIEGESCTLLENSNPFHKRPDHIRLFMLHTTADVDRLSLKTKLYESLRNVYGEAGAALIMPRSFFLRDPDDLEALTDLSRKDPSRMNTFIMKDETQHRQLGINLMTGASFLKTGTHSTIGIATMFLPRPYLVKGYKINIRRYMVAVCTGGRLRGYVHEDGKNIYTRLPYREPWEGEPWDEDHDNEVGEAGDAHRVEKATQMRLRLDEMITTGYVNASHYDGMPLSGLEFFHHVEKVDGRDYRLLQHSMWMRLALSLHASIRDGDYDLCDLRPHKIQGPAIPDCLYSSIRFQHFGCDFHIDELLSGFESRLFECNKGPDFSMHSLRDGVMKRDVAADILSFIGFKGPFNGVEEAASKHRMHLIYDSDIPFNHDDKFHFLENLKSASSKFRNSIDEEL